MDELGSGGLAEVTSRRIHAEFVALCGHLNVLHARMVELVAESLAVDAWSGPGLRSPEHWLAWQTGLSPSRAKRIVAMARRREELPVTFAAFANGELSVDQVAAVVAHARAHNDAEVCEKAKNATVSQLSATLSRFRFADDPKPDDPDPDDTTTDDGDEADAADDDDGDELDEAEAVRPGRDDSWLAAKAAREAAERDAAEAARVSAAVAAGRLSHGYNDDGRFYLHLELPADEGAVVDQALREAHNRLFDAGRKDVSWADALVDIAHRSLGAVESPDRRDHYRTYLHLDTEGAWINNGPGIPTTLLEKLTCDGQVRALWETEGLPINVGRKQHAIPAHTRRLVLDRDRICRYPGCANTRHLEVHHIAHWARDHGPTDTHNLAAHCPYHHDTIHRDKAHVTGNADQPDGLEHRLANGTIIRGHTKPTPPGTTPPPSPPPGHTYRHPLGEPIHNDMVWLASAPPTPPAPPEPEPAAEAA